MNDIKNNEWLKLSSVPEDPALNLICFPFAGGYAEYFLPWTKALSNVALYPIQLPGRSYRWKESVFLNVNHLVDALLPKMIPIFQEKPYVLFGHSMGGYIAYHCAKKIKECGLTQPISLIVSAVPSPILWTGEKHLSLLSPKEFMDFFLELGGFNPEILKHESFMKLQMELLRQDVQLCENCQYEGSAEFDFPIFALSAKHDVYVSYEDMRFWSQETNDTFQLEQVEGDHFYLNHQVDKIISIIQRVNYN